MVTPSRKESSFSQPFRLADIVANMSSSKTLPNTPRYIRYFLGVMFGLEAGLKSTAPYPVIGLMLLCFQVGLPSVVWGATLQASQVKKVAEQDRFSQERSLKELKEIQNKVRQVVKETMDACVSISDGGGFGSGVIVSRDGIILTAGHVINGDNERLFNLILPSGKTIRARSLGKNLNIDAGMLKIVDQGEYPFVSIAEEDCGTGDWVVSLGHSGGFELGRTPPVRTGRVLHQTSEELFTDAVLIGGDSGGPLFNLEGKLVGIHSSIGDSIAHNRHVAISAFQRDWNRLESGETWGTLPELDAPPKNKRGKIGVRVDLTAPNCRIRLVNDRSPASDAGIEVNDVVLEFNGAKIVDGKSLIQAIRKSRAGDVCTMKIRRDTTEFELTVQLR